MRKTALKPADVAGPAQGDMDWGEVAAPEQVNTGDADPLGGGRRAKAGASGGLETLWQRRFESIAQQKRFRELNEESRKSVHVVTLSDSDTEENP